MGTKGQGLKKSRGKGVNRVYLSLFLGVGLSVFSGLAAEPSVGRQQQAEQLYKSTQYEASAALLDKKAEDGPTTFLLGRNFFMMGDFKRSSEYLLKATAAEPGNSEYFDWLGRAYGRRAETSNPFAAPGLASKARQAFEKAVQLDGRNKDAMSDLFDYYLEAPGFLGGGYDKAADLAEKIAAVDPPEGYFSRARLAEKRKEFGSAEQALRKAVASAPHEISHVVTLAKFLANQGRTGESDAIFVQAQKTHPNSPELWYARADTLIKQKRNLEEAKALLQKYVRASITVDDPPKQDAIRLLKQVGGA